MNENENAVGEFIVTPLARSLAFGTAMQTVLARSYCVVPRWACLGGSSLRAAPGLWKIKIESLGTQA